MNQAFAQTADAEVALCNVLVQVYGRFDIVCADDTVFELAAEVRCEVVYSAAAFASIDNSKSYRIKDVSFSHPQRFQMSSIITCN